MACDTNGPRGTDALMQCRQLVTVAGHAEPRDRPDHLAQEVDDRADVVELQPQGGLPQVRHRQPGLLRPAAGPLRAAGLAAGWQRPGDGLVQLGVAARADLLGQERPARAQHPGHLRPPGIHRMAADHQVECARAERQRRVVRAGRDQDAAPRPEQPGRAGRVRRPGFGGDHARWPRREPGQHLAATGVQVERGAGLRQPCRGQPCVTPGRPLLRGPAVQPAEVPPVHRGCLGLGGQVLECPHQDDSMSSRPGLPPARFRRVARPTGRRPPCPRPGARGYGQYPRLCQ